MKALELDCQISINNNWRTDRPR